MFRITTRHVQCIPLCCYPIWSANTGIERYPRHNILQGIRRDKTRIENRNNYNYAVRIQVEVGGNCFFHYRDMQVPGVPQLLIVTLFSSIFFSFSGCLPLEKVSFCEAESVQLAAWNYLGY